MKLQNLWRRTRVRLAMWLNALWAVPLVLIMRALSPFVIIRLGSIDSTRIGHFAFDAACHITEIRRQPSKVIDWFWLGPTCNSQWELMVRRTLLIVQVTKWVDLWNRWLPGGESHSRPVYTDGRVPYGRILETPRSGMIPFLPSEIDSALVWLRSRGWTDGEPFVCLLVRDSAFLTHDPIQNKLDLRNSSQKWSYHDYRNSNIDDYVPAMEWLADQGVWVLRMGRIMERAIPTEHPRIVDYAFAPDKSDLLDIWLFANCTGCVSTLTGLDSISFVYGVPNLLVNATPLGIFWSFHESIWVGKHLYWEATGVPLTLSEYLSRTYGSSYRYAEAGIAIADLDPTEVTDAVQEFWHRIDGTWTESAEDETQQERFRAQLRTWHDFQLYHATIHPKSMIGAAWLRSAGERFLDASRSTF